MKDDPIVFEVRRIREALWQEAGCDLNRLGELVRRTAAGVSASGPIIANAEQLRRYIEQQQAAAPLLREEPPAYGEDSAKH
jgi:hypothetical protein